MKKLPLIQLSEHFTTQDMNCCCGCGLTVSTELLKKLEDLYLRLREPIVVKSAARCESWNTVYGGASGSYHLSGSAVDVEVKSSAHLFRLVTFGYAAGFRGIGVSERFVHLDLRSVPSPAVLFVYKDLSR